MSARPTLYSHLRGSLLGAWLAVVYGLAVLATAAMPTPVHAVVEGTVLCSGLSVPPADGPGADGADDPCKSCPTGPLQALPPVQQLAAPARPARLVVLAGGLSSGVLAPPGWRLPPSHAPPRAAS